jgi:adenosine deaminase
MIHEDLPLIDLHRHLDGNVRLATILDLARQHGLDLPADTLEGLRPHIQVSEPQTDIMAYFQKFSWMVSIFADEAACRRVAYENVVDAQAEGIDYIELRFSPWFMAEPHQLDPTRVVAAVLEGVRTAVEDLQDIQVNLIGIISLTYGVEVGSQELAALLAQKLTSLGWTWRAMKPTSRRCGSSRISNRHGMPVGESRCMPANQRALRACGMPSMT